jgi:FAD/FMN-containing dehydrogenase
MRQSISRRALLSAGLAGSSAIALTSSFLNSGSASAREAVKAGAASGPPDPGVLKSRFGFKGAVEASSDPGFEQAAVGDLWNKLQPKRHPQIIALANDEDDVVAAVKFARAARLKVTVRGGGHNWCNPSLRDKGLLIDLSKLNNVLSVDTNARKAVVQPIISNREMQSVLNSHGLSFPTGHCPEVKLSGYLLSGGMSWNHGVWGPGVGSVEAIELITAKGERITASASENPDYFWAARGCGPGFFAIALRYHLKLYPLPQAIVSSAYYYPHEHLVRLGKWLDALSPRLPSSVELSLFAIEAPPELYDKTGASHHKVALVSAVMFADTAEAARSTLAALDSYPALDQCLSRSVRKETNFTELFDGSGALWPSNLRSKVDAMFFNAPLAELCGAVKEHLAAAPSPKTVMLFSVYTGKNRPPATPSDAAFSMTAKLYGGPWTMWAEQNQDAANKAWHAKCVALLKPYVAGHYIGEADFAGHPEFAKLSYSPAAWARIAELRKKLDPEGLFFDFAEGLSA